MCFCAGIALEERDKKKRKSGSCCSAESRVATLGGIKINYERKKEKVKFLNSRHVFLRIFFSKQPLAHLDEKLVLCYVCSIDADETCSLLLLLSCCVE